jgi:hypothetical protein
MLPYSFNHGQGGCGKEEQLTTWQPRSRETEFLISQLSPFTPFIQSRASDYGMCHPHSAQVFPFT